MPGDVLEVRILEISLAVGYGYNRQRPFTGALPEEFAASHSYTQDQAVAAAQRYDVIVAYPQAFQPYVAAMRAANPNLVLLVYLNGMFLSPTQGSLLPAADYSCEANGVQVQNAKNHNYLTNAASSGSCPANQLARPAAYTPSE